MTPVARIRIVFNVGVLIGLLAMSAGAAIYAGAGAGAFVFGLVVWITTIVSTAFAIAMRRPGADEERG